MSAYLCMWTFMKSSKYVSIFLKSGAHMNLSCYGAHMNLSCYGPQN